MLEASDTPTPDTSPDTTTMDDSVRVSRELVERLQAEIKFKQTKIEALNFEIARLKRWRFGSSSESLDTSTQAVLFDAILQDTALEDLAAKEALQLLVAASAAPRVIKGRAVRQALPANLPRIERHYDIGATHCACGQAFKRIGEEVSEQLDCVPAQFFGLAGRVDPEGQPFVRHELFSGQFMPTLSCATFAANMLGACCQTIQAAPMPAQMIDLGAPAAGLLAQIAIAKAWRPSAAVPPERDLHPLRALQAASAQRTDPS